MPTVTLMPFPKFQAMTTAGPLAFGLVYTYQAGTTTPLATYTDQGGGTANANPLTLDAQGEADVWFIAGDSYKVSVHDANDAPLWTVDNIIVPTIPTSGSILPTGASWVRLAGTFTAAAYSGQAEIPLAGFFPTYNRVLFVEVTVTQQFGTSNGLASLMVGTSVTNDQWGGGLTLTTGVKPQRDGGTPMYTTATTLSLFSSGGLFDATGIATVRALALKLT
jgi:hypothetical protein